MKSGPGVKAVDANGKTVQSTNKNALKMLIVVPGEDCYNERLSTG